MTIDTLTKQNAEVHTGLAGMDIAKLKQLRSQQMKDCFRHFDETHFRMEFVAKIGNTEFINDAAARNVNATWYSLENTSGPLVWIAVGSFRHVNYTLLEEAVIGKVAELICVGDYVDQLMTDFKGLIPHVEEAFTIEEAVHKAYYNRAEVHKVLFSPACDCSGMSEQLGRRFINEINEL